MKLYHFCPGCMLAAIKREGLTKGGVPLIKNGRSTIVPGYQWLTVNKSFDQSWEKNGSLPYRRNEYRITVKIPKSDKNLVKWLDVCGMEGIQELTKVLNYAGDPQNWYLYEGRIKPGYFRDIIKNPRMKD